MGERRSGSHHLGAADVDAAVDLFFDVQVDDFFDVQVDVAGVLERLVAVDGGIDEHVVQKEELSGVLGVPPGRVRLEGLVEARISAEGGQEGGFVVRGSTQPPKDVRAHWAMASREASRSAAE
jgi:hypothetical protein